jgi:hypothetical protein
MAVMEMTDEVRRFILTSVPSVPYLEAILLLRAGPDVAWDRQNVARRLYLPPQQAAEILQALAAAGIAQPRPGAAMQFVYAPSTAELAAMLDQVAAIYAASLRKVTNLIHSSVDKRAQQFADGFRWRKDS